MFVPFRLAVFDLDYTIWKPEMYQCYGPMKRKQVGSRVVVTDRYNTEIEVFDGANYALSQINELRDKTGMDLEVAVASRTDEPEWAQQCMDWITIDNGRTLSSCTAHVEIDKSDKQYHFKRLHEKTGVPYESMAFFDNEMSNIRSVEKMGVKCFYTPEGMTRRAWDACLKSFGMST